MQSLETVTGKAAMSTPGSAQNVSLNIHSLLSTFSDISRHQFGACDPQGQPYLSVHRQYQRNLLQTLCLAKDETADAFAFALEAVVLKTKHSCATANLDHLLILAKIYQSYKPGWDLDITILRSLRNILAELLDHGLSRHAQYISGTGKWDR